MFIMINNGQRGSEKQLLNLKLKGLQYSAATYFKRILSLHRLLCN